MSERGRIGRANGDGQHILYTPRITHLPKTYQISRRSQTVWRQDYKHRKVYMCNAVGHIQQMPTFKLILPLFNFKVKKLETKSSHMLV